MKKKYKNYLLEANVLRNTIPNNVLKNVRSY